MHLKVKFDDINLRDQRTSAFRFVILVVGVVSFGNSYNGSFAFDDNEAIINNKDVSSSGSMSELFYRDFWGSNISSSSSHKSYRPLVIMSFKINYWWFGKLNSTSFHLVNIVLYGSVCVLFFEFFLILYHKIENREMISWDSKWLSFLAALLFTLHPLHTENVSAIVGRADLMCSIFFLGAFFFYVKLISISGKAYGCIRSVLYLCAFVFCCLCSLLSKEQGITVFGICFIYDLILENNITTYATIRSFKKTNGSKLLLLRTILLMILSSMFMVFRWKIMNSEMPKFQKFDNPHSFVSNPLFRVINYNYLYYLNAWLLINPWWLCFDWSMGCVPIINSPFDWRMLVVIFLNAFLFITLLMSLLKMEPKDRRLVWHDVMMSSKSKCCLPCAFVFRLIIISVCVIIIPFLPSSNCFFKVGFVIAERNLFISSAGICLLVVAGMNRLALYKKTTYFIFTLLLLVYFARSIQRSSHWLNEEKLFSTGLQVCPLNAKVHYNVAKLEADKGNKDVALKRYHIALRLAPEYDQALNNLGNLYKESGNFEMAERYLKKAVSVRPEFAAAWMNLGITRASMKKFREAETSYKIALRIKAKYPDCHYNLGNLYLDQGDYSNALMAWRNATLQNPQHIAAWVNMLILLDNMGLFKDVDVVAQNALKHNPSESSLYFNYANSLGKVGRYEESEKNFLLALKYRENMANYHSNLGVLYHRWKKFDKANHHYKIALELDPNNTHLLRNYKLLQSMRNN